MAAEMTQRVKVIDGHQAWQLEFNPWPQMVEGEKWLLKTSLMCPHMCYGVCPDTQNVNRVGSQLFKKIAKYKTQN